MPRLSRRDRSCEIVVIQGEDLIDEDALDKACHELERFERVLLDAAGEAILDAGGKDSCRRSLRPPVTLGL